MNDQNQTFRPYPDCPQYLIGDRGTVISKYGRTLTPYVDKIGYRRIRLVGPNVKTCFLHRIVAQTFIPNPENLPEINHIDHDKGNNRIENLEWVTHRNNIHKARSFHGDWSRKGGDSANARALIARPIGGGEPVRWACARDFMRAASGQPGWCGNISRAARSGRPAYGFRWSFADSLQYKAQ